ncbi:DNA mismatch repair protein MutS2 [Alkalihalobacillus xiaoxiensis]|uniref:Endonuclease MutS2 n=1 Tax=Shouchella xiaoxiensis TaxID=766895 RepID=A0ABS2SSM7_9BACI|nr:endonuclease MutS2 [Shouchella xiaoxiensis]MBM7838517.1 DNA mismatch repair protein MutS2 [Shouchella xiaoxiensis]
MEHVQRVLEYSKMKKQLLEHVASSLGRQKINELIPSVHLQDVQKMQDETAEAVTVVRLKGQIPLGGISDVRPHIKRTAIGGALSATELMEIASTLYGAKRVKHFFEDLIEDGHIDVPYLYELASSIEPLSPLEKAIKQCIDDNGYVLDHASTTLRTVRQQIRSFESNVKSKLEQMTRSSGTRKMLSDAIVTIRGDRYVIPVKQEYRGNFGGIIHDQSSSGATLFIEPASIVTLNNQLTEAKVKEKREIERILTDLSNQVGEEAEALLQNVETLASVDFICAKAYYARSIKAIKPKLNENGYLDLKQARHPLLPVDEVVPSDISIGGQIRSLVITGPNTGGKTVTLKTIGLLTLMAQSGLHIPADDETELAVFEHIFADIGDEQSIEQSLSTFSSHMKNIVSILKEMNANSLVLFDELGAGTDPTEGAALAISILDYVYKRGALAAATTHYSELKGYAYNREGALNASVEFDVETLRPTYRLLVGVPGRSNAFAISRRLGLSEDVIEQAKLQIDSEATQVEKMIASLEDSQKSAEKERSKAETIRKEAAVLKSELEAKVKEFDQLKDGLMEEAERKAAKAIADAKEEADVIISELRDMQKQGLSVKEHKLIDAKKHLEEAAPKLLNKKQRQVKRVAEKAKQTPKPGDEVKVISFNQKGSVIKQINESEFQVQLGIMKMTVNVNDMQVVEKAPEPTKSITTIWGNQAHVKPELDLRGERYEDAMRKIEKYIDDALLAGYHHVSLIHGKGTGALRKGVKQYVANHPRIKSARDGGSNEGGLGNTVVELK